MTALEFLEAIIKHCERFGTLIEQKDIDEAKEMEKEQLQKAIEYGYQLRNNNKPINSGIDWVKEFNSLNK